MTDRRRILAFGVAGVMLALELMQPSALVTVPLLLASLFLIAWAIVPDVVRRWARRTGRVAPFLLSGLDRLDALLAHAVGGPAQDSACLKYIGDKITEGSQLLNRRVTSDEELGAWLSDYKTWTDDVYAEIESNFSSAQAVAFRTIGVTDAAMITPFYNERLNTKKLRLKKRLDRLVAFVNTNKA